MSKLYIKFCIFMLLISGTIVAQQDKTTTLEKLLPSTSAISVTIGGTFIVNGTFPAIPNERVDQFVTRIYNTARENAMAVDKENPNRLSDLKKELATYAKRNIQLLRANGSKIMLDLEKFRYTGDFKNNPYLQNDDVLIFPKVDMDHNFVGISGAVNKETIFQFVDGDRLSDALLFADGLNKAYENIKSVEINRLSYDGEKLQKLVCNISEDPILQRGDRVIVLADETQRKNFFVLVAGEVSRPGKIPITHNSTTLKEIVDAVGGFRSTADLNRAELIRGANAFRSVVFTEEFEAMMMQRMANISPEDSSSFLIDNKLRFARGNGTIDFSKISDTNSQASKFVVKDGDYIYIPEKVNLVYVFGQVNIPGYIQYKEGENYSYYITKAGGKGITAKDDIYVIKGKTRSWIKIDDDVKVVIEPGDYIWIPKTTPRNFSFYLQRVTAISSIIGTIATLVLVFAQFK